MVKIFSTFTILSKDPAKEHIQDPQVRLYQVTKQGLGTRSGSVHLFVQCLVVIALPVTRDHCQFGCSCHIVWSFEGPDSKISCGLLCRCQKHTVEISFLEISDHCKNTVNSEEQSNSFLEFKSF